MKKYTLVIDTKTEPPYMIINNKDKTGSTWISYTNTNYYGISYSRYDYIEIQDALFKYSHNSRFITEDFSSLKEIKRYTKQYRLLHELRK